MGGSRVAQSLDSLWFYTNILTCRGEPAANLTDQFAPSNHAKECPKRPNTPFLVNQQHEPRKVQNLTPKCHNFGEISSAFEEVRATVPGNKEKRDRRKRRKWNKLGLYGTNVVRGGLDLGFDKFQEESYKYQMLNNTQQQIKMPPFDDDVAMKQHLKSWAYAVACTVR
ncbi:hypothetical protein E2542_SST17153 [Spatholobus suberectus]|nr:hypothetical protein E2542_SST17153 [Spatholobus suberectus]